jgi:hypothetical protein
MKFVYTLLLVSFLASCAEKKDSSRAHAIKQEKRFASEADSLAACGPGNLSAAGFLVKDSSKKTLPRVPHD